MLQAQIFINKNDLKDMKPLYEFIFQFLIKHDIKGATAFRGRLGFGPSHYLNYPDLLFSFDQPPMLITFIDEDEKVKRTLTELRKVMPNGFIITSKVEQWI